MDISSTKIWLVDFEETLAPGCLTFAINQSIPKFIQQYQLEYDGEHLAKVVLTLQERARQNPGIHLLLVEFFEQMHWPQEARVDFMNDIMADTPPYLFDDAIPFLERFKQKGQRVFIVSNNRSTPENIKITGLETYVEGVFTPFNTPNTQPKPNPSLWEHILNHAPDIEPENVAVVGDDPWSDGAFADTCKLRCWIVDRMNRFSEMRSKTPYFWVTSLLDIPI